MNIKDAKEQIQNAVKAYFTKDEFGGYVIPIERQRPVFLIGAPGIGKTAIMEQIAQELNVGLVSYSMTHHTRQSALGLPFITKEDFDGREYSVSEYTMSEIIASVYKLRKETGHQEGILFLDEVNCVSETLAPSMLQFLQYKTFGTHRLPPGWIVVTAGNPPEYNKSVREFDIVTWDRLKRIDVEPDYEVWKEYAYKKGIHGAVMTFLEIKNRARNARFDERLSLLGMLIDAVNGKMRSAVETDNAILEVLRLLKLVKAELAGGAEYVTVLHRHLDAERQALKSGEQANSIDYETRYAYRYVIRFLEDVLDQCGRQGITSNGDAFALIKTAYDAAVSAHKQKKMVVQENLRHLFEFVEEVYSEGQELMILVTELTVRYYCAKFIAKFGCTEYFKHNQDMLFHERRYGLLKEIDALSEPLDN